MRQLTLAAFVLVPTLVGFSVPARAYDYGVFSGRGYNEAFGIGRGATVGEVVADALGIQTDEVPLGTAAKPAPVYPPAVLFRVHPSTIYNAPPAPSDLYRVVPLR